MEMGRFRWCIAEAALAQFTGVTAFFTVKSQGGSGYPEGYPEHTGVVPHSSGRAV